MRSTLHDRERSDAYAWLRDKESPAVRAHLEAENAYVQAVMAPAETLRARIAGEILKAVKQEPAGRLPRGDRRAGSEPAQRDLPLLAPGCETRRLRARARDGVEVPVTLLVPAGVKQDGTAPLVLYGFGAYGTTLPSDFAPAYSAERAPLLTRGVVFAFAHVRGGGEGGDAWHEAGRVMKKERSFHDFVDVAEHLARERWCASDRIAAMGESAGGLLVTAAANERPDIFRCVLALYPFVDVVTTMLDASLPGTTDEYDEWGDPRDPAQATAMLRWSPYDNLAPRRYPAMLLRTALDDDEVMYWEPAKFAARMRSVTTSGKPVLLETDFQEAGHLGSEEPQRRSRDRALDWAFVLRELGVER